jgi:hypothetical protein
MRKYHFDQSKNVPELGDFAKFAQRGNQLCVEASTGGEE